MTCWSHEPQSQLSWSRDFETADERLLPLLIWTEMVYQITGKDG